MIRELPDRHTYDGWLWFEAYELGSAGRAVAKRELFVRREGCVGSPPRPPWLRAGNHAPSVRR